MLACSKRLKMPISVLQRVQLDLYEMHLVERGHQFIPCRNFVVAQLMRAMAFEQSLPLL